MLFSKSHSLIIASLLMVPALTQAAVPLGNESSGPAAGMRPPGQQPGPNTGVAPGDGPPRFGPPHGDAVTNKTPPFGPPHGDAVMNKTPPFGPPKGREGADNKALPRFGPSFGGKSPGGPHHPQFNGQKGHPVRDMNSMHTGGMMGHAGLHGGMNGHHGIHGGCPYLHDECSLGHGDEESESESCSCSHKKSHKKCGGCEEEEEDECEEEKDECKEENECKSRNHEGGKHHGVRDGGMMGGPRGGHEHDFDQHMSMPHNGLGRDIEHEPHGDMMDEDKPQGCHGGCKKACKQKCKKSACKCCERGCGSKKPAHPMTHKSRAGFPPAPHPFGPGPPGHEPAPPGPGPLPTAPNPLVKDTGSTNSTAPIATDSILPKSSSPTADDDEDFTPPAPGKTSPSSLTPPIPSPTIPDVPSPVSSLPGSLRSQPGSHRGLDSPAPLKSSLSVHPQSSSSSISPSSTSSISPMDATATPSTESATPRIDNPLIIPSDLVSSSFGTRAQIGLSVVFVAAAALFV